MASLLAIVALLLLAQLANSQPTIYFPFNAQLPLAARIDKFFSYSFSPLTFQSDSKISYSLGEHPSWLSIDSEERRLFGTPKEGDVHPGEVVGQTVDIIATDGKGSTSMNAVVVVSRQSAPQVEIPLEKQIQNFGNFSAPSSILSYPSASFNFSFDQGTFSKAALNYYAVSGDSSPLPAWVKFDASSLTFSGRTPAIESLIQPPHAFDFELVASDIVGFSASSIEFSIVVGSHKLTTDFPIVTLNASRGAEVIYDGLEKGIKLDGKQVAAGDGGLTVVVKDKPSWLSFDQKSWKLHGTPREGDRAANFTVTFKDDFSDNLDVLMVVNVATGLFASTIGDLHLRPGSELDLDLAKYFKTPGDIAVTLSTSPHEDWIKVDGLKLSGQVPKTSSGGIKLSIQASSKSSDLTENETINVSFLAADGTTTTGTSATTSTATAVATKTTGGDGDDEAQAKSDHHLGTGEILLATIIPVIFVAVFLLVLLCYIRRRRRRNQGTNLGDSPHRSNISRPVLCTPGPNDSVTSMEEAATLGGGVFVHSDKLVTKTTEASLGDASSSAMSSHRRSSETLGGHSTSGVPRRMAVDAARTATIRSISNIASEDGRQSWVTIDAGNAGLASSSERSSPSRKSDRTYSGSTYQVLPGAVHPSHQKRDAALAALDRNHTPLKRKPVSQPMALFAHTSDRPPLAHDSVGGYSGVTSSSVALPAYLKNMEAHADAEADADYTSGALTRWTTGSTAGRDISDPNWFTLAQSDLSGSVADQASSRPATVAPHAGSGHFGSSSGKSIGTGASFTSSENWRIIGRCSPVKTERSYKELVEESPFHPSRPSLASASAGAGAGADDDDGAAASVSPEVMAGSRWRDRGYTMRGSPGQMGLHGSIVSRMRRESGQQDVHMSGGKGFVSEGRDMDSWIREHSTKKSDGSFTVFL
ncbi:hypothetical protein E4U17_004247 [Claviceps sp. LM77 group G4]|nr:hypothetical protein E4U17_004247 [Claviceps sp. LM77 group G4]KAG6073592.1 hypothetical protein E4U16_004615 [Claviceps sp. LM84 group G4]